MKQKSVVLFACLCLLAHNIANAQGGPKWSVNGNSLSAGDFLGSSNYFPIVFRTNNQPHSRMLPNGNFQVLNLSGSGNRLLMADANGNLLPFVWGNSNQVLFGNGTWADLPESFSPWLSAGGGMGGGLNNNNAIYYNGNVGIFNSNPLVALDVTGDARISNNLYVGGGIVITDKVNAATEVTTTAVRADSILMDSTKAIFGTTRVVGDAKLTQKLQVGGDVTINGGLKLSNLPASNSGGNYLVMGPGGTVGVGLPIGIAHSDNSCAPSQPHWTQGGNTLVAGTETDYYLGTCNATHLVMKTNNFEAMRLTAGSLAGIGLDPDNLSISGFSPARLTVKDGISVTNNAKTQAVSLIHDGAAAQLDLFGAAGSANNILGIGTYSNVDVVIGQGPAGSGLNSGNLNVWGVVKIGHKQSNTAHPDAQLLVDGKVVATSLYATVKGWPDYVFEKDYQLLPLDSVEQYYLTNKHLPQVPSEKEMLEKGVDVAEMNKLLMQKVEELTLYIVELKKEIAGKEAQDKKIEELTTLIKQLSERMAEVEKKK